MARRTVPPSLWSGSDRVRIGKRLQASLAGILELELLREAQRSTVESALGRREMEESEEPSDGGQKEPLPPAKLDRSKSEDLLGAPKKQHVSYGSSENVAAAVGGGQAPPGGRAGESCLGLRLASEQLLCPKRPGGQAEPGFNTAEAQEVSEADSRPSSGFYETSEMGSLSDSCASVHSECPGGSRCSVNSLSQLPGPRETNCTRPRSTDEAAVRLLDLQLQRLALADVSRRPVSTGDLEFLLSLGDFSLPFPKHLGLQLLPYKCDLVSRNTNEIYHYPSPLHAVALQSPLFTSSLSQGSSQEDLSGVPRKEPGVPPQSSAVPSEEQWRARLDRYISKLVLRYKCRSVASRAEAGYFAGPQKSLSASSVGGSPLGPGQLLASAPGWKIRRRISTCSHLRSPEGPEGSRDSQASDGQTGRDSATSLEISSIRSSMTDVSKAGSLPEPLQAYREPGQPSSGKECLNGSGGTPFWLDGSHPHVVRVKASSKKGLSPPWIGSDSDRLYRGKHSSRELVKAAEGTERSWLSPRELLRRLSLRRRPPARVENGSRANSEMNVHTAAGLGYRCDPQPRKDKAGKHKWASVLEISSKAPMGHQKAKADPFQPPLSRHLAFSTDSPASFCFPASSQLDLRPRRPGYGSSGSSLSEVDVAASDASLNGDWLLRHLSASRARPLHTSATLNSSDLPAASFKLRRSRSFKELRRMVTRSLKGSGASK
uniref:Dapper homolog 2 n=1 Tax=Sphenodon punctatus TaxID=8508 RepID=A0A8D0L6H9_SPHPU